jgi:hypothetical protein
MLSLANPLLSPETPLNDRRLWFTIDPSQRRAM